MPFDRICTCPLCATYVSPAEIHVRDTHYRHCDVCDLVFQEPTQRLTAADELAHYGTHENDVRDPRYRRFLSQLADPLREMLPYKACGLDYGAGPGPALAAMFRESGFEMAVYDPFFAPDESVLERAYDFVTSTEVVEHMHHPGREFERIDQLLRPNGLLGLMTELRPALENFANWYYHRDPTHVCFYSPDTIRWIVRRHSWSIEHLGTRVIILRKAGRIHNQREDGQE